MKSKINLKWGFGADLDFLGHMRDAAKRMNERAGSDINVEVCGTEYVHEFEIFQAVQSGKLDMGFTQSGYGKHAGLLRSEVGQLPIWPSGAAGCAFTKAVLDKYIRSDMEALGVAPIIYQINSADDYGRFSGIYYAQIWCNKLYSSLADAKGARVFAQTETSGSALSAMGMIPAIIPYLDTFQAFSENRLDGALMSSITPTWCKLTDIIACCLKIDYPQSEDNFTVMNLKTYNSLPADVRNIIIEEVRNWQALITDRPKVAKTGWDNFWNERIKDGRLKMIELTPDEKASCKQLWEEKSINEWITRQTAKGFKDARAYLDELLELRESILASGLPQYTGPIY